MPKQNKNVSELSFYHSKITEWPKEERPREKLIKYGAASLSDAELIAILLRTGAGKITAVDLAKTLIREFRTLNHLSSRTLKELEGYKGLGEVKSVTLQAAFELGRRSATAKGDSRVKISSPEDVVKIFSSRFRDLKQEMFQVLLLDSANHLLDEKVITVGILNSSLVHPREVFQPAILEPAASIILLHNHPSGNPEPSPDDLQITRQIVEAGKILGIPVHDHIILAIDKYCSFVEKGLL